jgi:hypothetical protein
MNNGMWATIVEYRGCNDIDVQFEDGAIAKNKAYGAFKKGSIAYPIPERKGERRKMNNGMGATIVVYRNNSDIDVQFDDGAIARDRTYGSFVRGTIAYPTASKRKGERRKMNNGMWATIVAYRGCSNITVQFEDGAIVKHRLYSHFKKGHIAHPKL